MIPNLHVQILGGLIKLYKGEAKLCKDHLLTLEGKDVNIIVEKHKNIRTVPQNAYLWSVVYKLIADYTGHDTEDIHEFCKDVSTLLSGETACIYAAKGMS